jgi:tetratricopeptide (TPR) repeat protein
MRLLFSTSVPNFKLERSQLEKPLVIPYNIPYWKKEKLINLLTYGLREKAPLLMETNWSLVEKELETQQRPQKINAFRLLRNEIIIIEIETQEQLRSYNRKYSRLPVLLTVATLKNPNIRAPRKWISDLKLMLIESVQRTVFEDKLIEPKLFGDDFPSSFILQNFEDPIDCIDFLNLTIQKMTLQIEKNNDVIKINEEFLRSTFCEVIADQLAELSSDELKLLYSLALTDIPEEISDLTSMSRKNVMKTAEGLYSKGFMHIYGNLISPTAPIKKLSEPKYFEKIGKSLRESIPDRFNITEELYSKILQSIQPLEDAFLLERNDISSISTTEITPDINISTIKESIKTKIPEIGLDDFVDVDNTEKLLEICSRILWKEKDEKKRRVLFSARSLAYLFEKNTEKSLQDASMIMGDEEYVNILRRLYLENSKLLIIQGKWSFAIEILEKAIEISKNIDEIQGDLIIQLGFIFENRGEYDKASKLYKESLRIYKELGDKSGIATTLRNLGNIHLHQGNYEEAVKKYNQSLKIAEELGDKSGIAKALHNLGNIHYFQGNYEEAVKLYNQSLKMGEELRNKSGIAKTLRNLGNIHYFQGNYEEAVKLYNQSLKMGEELRNKSGIAKTLHNLGNIHYSQGNYEEAVKKYNQSLRIAEELGDKSGIATTLHQLGNVQCDQGNYEEAVKLYNQSLKMKEELGDKRGIANSLGQLGMIHLHQGNYEEAVKLYNQALKIDEELGNKSGIASTLHQLGRIDEEEGECSGALRNYFSSLSIFEKLNSPDKEIVTRSISRLRDKMGEENFKEAYQELESNKK